VTIKLKNAGLISWKKSPVALFRTSAEFPFGKRGDFCQPAQRHRRCGMLLGLIFLLPGAPRAETPMVNRYLPAEKLPWYQEAPNVPVKLAPLWGDRATGEAGTLLSAPAGFKSGAHSHTADYWAVVVAGTWEHWVPSTGEGKGIRLTPGAHWTQVRTQLHEDACVSTIPCTIFLFNKDPYKTEFPKKN